MFKPKIQWVEPKEFKSVMREDANKPNPLLVLLGLPLLVSWYANKEDSGVPLWVAILLCLVLGAFLVYGVPLLVYHLPTKVQLHKKAIIKHDRQQPIPIEYKKMKEFSILDTGAVSILAIIGIDGTAKRCRRVIGEELPHRKRCRIEGRFRREWTTPFAALTPCHLLTIYRRKNPDF